MNLNLRPMSKAPLGVPILAGLEDDSWQVFALSNPYRGDAKGFYLLADVLAAVELLRNMQPVGYEFTGEWRPCNAGEPWFGGLEDVLYPEVGTKRPVPILRKLPEPVEYRYDAEASKRPVKLGDFYFDDADNVWREALSDCNGVALCARRVEVKR